MITWMQRRLFQSGVAHKDTLHFTVCILKTSSGAPSQLSNASSQIIMKFPISTRCHFGITTQPKKRKEK